MVEEVVLDTTVTPRGSYELRAVHGPCGMECCSTVFSVYLNGENIHVLKKYRDVDELEIYLEFCGSLQQWMLERFRDFMIDRREEDEVWAEDAKMESTDA